MVEELRRFAKPLATESSPSLEGIQRSRFLKDYLAPAKEVDRQYPGHYEAEKKLAEEFLDYPGRFRPTKHAVKSAYADFVVTPSIGRVCWPSEVGARYPIREGAMRNVEVRPEYEYSSTAGRDCAIIAVYAEVPEKDEGTGRTKWIKRRSGGIAFNLKDWVERVPEGKLESSRKQS